jgi:hypothetical protein
LEKLKIKSAGEVPLVVERIRRGGSNSRLSISSVLENPFAGAATVSDSDSVSNSLARPSCRIRPPSVIFADLPSSAWPGRRRLKMERTRK